MRAYLQFPWILLSLAMFALVHYKLPNAEQAIGDTIESGLYWLGSWGLWPVAITLIVVLAEITYKGWPESGPDRRP